MSWDFKFYKDNDLNDVIAAIERELNNLAFQDRNGNEAAVTAKVAISNRQDGDATGVIFFDEAIQIMPPPAGQIQFSNQVESTSGSDPKGIFEAVKTKLNELDSTEAYWARLALTDRRGGNTNAILFWPERQD